MKSQTDLRAFEGSAVAGAVSGGEKSVSYGYITMKESSFIGLSWLKAFLGAELGKEYYQKLSEFLAEERKKIGKKSHLMIGARTKDLLLFMERTKKSGIQTYYSTNDGSFGFKGFNTELLEDFLKKNKVDKVVTCGPELMMKKVLDICVERGIPCEVSIERYMKCGFGICGACVMGDKVVCTDGPIFTGKELSANLEFGKCARLKTGKRVSLKEYYGV